MVSTGKFPAILRQNAHQSVRMICAFSLSYKKFALWKLCDPACRKNFVFLVRKGAARLTIRKGGNLTCAVHMGFNSLMLMEKVSKRTVIAGDRLRLGLPFLPLVNGVEFLSENGKGFRLSEGLASPVPLSFQHRKAFSPPRYPLYFLRF